MTRFALVLSMVSLASLPAFADVFDPICCETSLDAVQRLLLIPDENGTDSHPAGSFTVTIRNMACNPVPAVIVTVDIAGLAEGRTRLCGSSVVSAVTDGGGVARLNVAGGGCFKGPHAVVIRGNGVTIREFLAVVSPDYAAYDNQGIPGRSDLRVSVADFASFAHAFWHGSGSTCHDYNNNGTMDAADFSVFAQVWSGGNRDCSP